MSANPAVAKASMASAARSDAEGGTVGTQLMHISVLIRPGDPQVRDSLPSPSSSSSRCPSLSLYPCLP